MTNIEFLLANKGVWLVFNWITMHTETLKMHFKLFLGEQIIAHHTLVDFKLSLSLYTRALSHAHAHTHAYIPKFRTGSG